MRISFEFMYVNSYRKRTVLIDFLIKSFFSRYCDKLFLCNSISSEGILIGSFPLKIFSVNVNKSAGNYGFGHIYWRNPSSKTSFFVQCFFRISWFYEALKSPGNFNLTLFFVNMPRLLTIFRKMLHCKCSSKF